jgi:hypothetical protein
MEETIFILRRWRNKRSEAWRWSLKEINSGETLFFSSEKKLDDYLKSLQKYVIAEILEDSKNR